MRTTHTTTKGSEKSPSSRAIEAAISVFLYDPLSKAAPLLPDQTTKALLSLVDDATDAADLLQALDCAADDPDLKDVGFFSLPTLVNELWHVGASTMTVHEKVRFAIGAKASNRLEQVGPMMRDLWLAAADFQSKQRHYTDERATPIVYDPTIPTELNEALAKFHMAIVALMVILAASTARRKRLAPSSALTLVDTVDEGLSLFMPWMLLSPSVSFSAETRARLRTLDFDSIFERHFRQSEALAHFIAEDVQRR